MSEESDYDVFSHAVRRGKRRSRIEDSGSSSDSPFEQHRKRRGVPVSDIFKLSVVCFSMEHFCFPVSNLNM